MQAETGEVVRELKWRERRQVAAVQVRPVSVRAVRWVKPVQVRPRVWPVGEVSAVRKKQVVRVKVPKPVVEEVLRVWEVSPQVVGVKVVVVVGRMVVVVVVVVRLVLLDKAPPPGCRQRVGAAEPVA
jgi:hypothetical protein